MAAMVVCDNDIVLILFQNEFVREYQEALDKCFTLCIPETMSLEEVQFNKQFVGMYVLTVSITSCQH